MNAIMQSKSEKNFMKGADDLPECKASLANACSEPELARTLHPGNSTRHSRQSGRRIASLPTSKTFKHILIYNDGRKLNKYFKYVISDILIQILSQTNSRKVVWMDRYSYRYRKDIH